MPDHLGQLGGSQSFFTPEEWDAIVVGLRHLLGEPFTGDLRVTNPLWRSVIRKIEAVD